MQAVTVKCPECGGLLDAGTSTTVTCQYCGAAARIQRRSQVFQLPRALPPVRPEDPPAVARQVPVKGPLIAVFVAGFIFVGGIVFSIVLTTRAASRATTPAITTARSTTVTVDAPEPVHWRGGPPLVHDADGDGIDDLVGLRRYYGKQDKMAIVALSGKDGRVLWETPSLGTYMEVYRSKLALVDGVVLRGDTVANLDGFAARDGKPLWKTEQGEVVEAFCAGVATSDAGGTVLVKTADDKWWSVTVATGARTPVPKRGRDARCGRIQALGHEETLEREELPSNTVAIPEVSVSKVFTRGTAPNIAIGYKRPGTAVAMVAGVTSSGKLVWKSEVPAETPLRSRLWGSDDVVLDDAVVALFYEYQEGPPALTVFDRATGNRAWNVRLPEPEHGSFSLSGLGLTRDLVVVTTTDAIYAFELRTGAPRWTIARTRAIRP